MDPEAIRNAIRERALSEGFAAAGFAPARLPRGAAADLAAFLAEGRHAGMDWMARPERARGPAALLPGARSVIVLAAGAAPTETPPRDPGSGVIAAYARARDYHDALRKAAKRLARWIGESWPCAARVFVDTAPLMEKPLAARTAIGWRGRHTNIVSRRFGSWLLLAEIVTDLDLPPDTPEPDRCGTCDRCRTACPTGALDGAGHIDPRRCVAYLTIEHKDHIPEALRPGLGNRVFGCDDCLAACPWNRFAPVAAAPGPIPAAAPLADLAELDDAAFRARFAGTPVKRTGRDRFVRNVLVAIGNSADPGLAPAARRLLDDPSPLVREAAAWALARLDDGNGS